MSLKINAKILNMTYDKENNLFQIDIQDIDANKKTGIAIKGTDWGVTPDVPEDIIEQFCKDMIGKEKKLYIEVDNSSIRDAEKNEEGKVPQKEIDKINSNLDNYPINEVMNILHKDIKETKDED